MRYQSRQRKQVRAKLNVVLVATLIFGAVGVTYVMYRELDTDSDGVIDFQDPDDDNDGIPDSWELTYGLNPKYPDDCRLDLDRDKLINRLEYKWGTHPKLPDTDLDGVIDGIEITIGTDPLKFDTDNDSIPDGWEYKYGFDPIDATDAIKDPDRDLLCNFEEYINFTDPLHPDTDNDGMPDGWELHNQLDPRSPEDADDDYDLDGLTNAMEYLYGTGLRAPDTDADGIIDGDEINVYSTNATNRDSDSDGMTDGWEIKYGLAPLDPRDAYDDPDNDSLDNYREWFYETNPLHTDTDLDGMPDWWEVEYKFSTVTGVSNLTLEPTIADADGDIDIEIIEGGVIYPMPDGLTNIEEYMYGTDPTNPDTDGDLLLDGEELKFGWYGELIDGVFYTTGGTSKYYTNPLSNDTDSDGLSDYIEIFIKHTNASNRDTDQDGILDREELFDTSTNASNIDTDHDAISDYDEIYGSYGYITNPRYNDTDRDGMMDGDEIFTDFYPFEDFDTTIYNCVDLGAIDGTNPLDNDTDNDEIIDGWEFLYGGIKLNETAYEWLLNPLNHLDASQDPDNDFLNNSGEYSIYAKKYRKPGKCTDPLDWDTDNDGMPDGWEIKWCKWMWCSWLHDGKGGYKYTPDPLNAMDAYEDPDEDGVYYTIDGVRYYDDFTNLEEYLWGKDLDRDGRNELTTDPNNFDTNNDGRSDYYGYWFNDDDGDALYTGWELLFNGTTMHAPAGYHPVSPRAGEFNPYDSDSNGNNIMDTYEDPDDDGYSNLEEQLGGSDPTNPYSAPAARKN